MGPGEEMEEETKVNYSYIYQGLSNLQGPRGWGPRPAQGDADFWGKRNYEGAESKLGEYEVSNQISPPTG